FLRIREAGLRNPDVGIQRCPTASDRISARIGGARRRRRHAGAPDGGDTPMNFKRLFATAVVVNVALLGIVLWLWSSRKQSPPEKPAQTTPQPMPIQTESSAKPAETPLTP